MERGFHSFSSSIVDLLLLKKLGRPPGRIYILFTLVVIRNLCPPPPPATPGAGGRGENEF